MSKYKVNLSELWVGREFKNYKDICSAMGWAVYKSGSNGFQAQIKELKTYCDWERSGHKYTIVEVYNKPLKKTDGRKGNVRKNETQELAEQVLINLMANAEEVGAGGKVLRITKFKLFQALGLTNQNFGMCFKHPDITQDLLDTSSVATQYYLGRTYDKASDRVETLFKNMEKRNLIIKHNVIIYCDMDGVLHKANADKEGLIIGVKRKQMNLMGYKDKDGENLIIADGRWKEYSNSVNQELKKYGIKYFFKAYDIVCSDYYKSRLKELYDEQVSKGITLDSLTQRINVLTLESNRQTFANKVESVKNNAPTMGVRQDNSSVIMNNKWGQDGEVLFSACGDINNKESLEPQIKERLRNHSEK